MKVYPTHKLVQVTYFYFPFSNAAVLIRAGSRRSLSVTESIPSASRSLPSPHTYALQQTPHR